MTINSLARMMVNRDRYQRQSATPNLPNGSLPPKGHVNPYYPESMNANQGLKTSVPKAAAMRPKICRSRPVRERTVEAV